MTFRMVSKPGLRSPDNALYKLSLERPASRATFVMPLASAISPSALTMNAESQSEPSLISSVGSIPKYTEIENLI